MSAEKKQEPAGSPVATVLAAVAGGVCVYFVGPLSVSAVQTFEAAGVSLSVPTQIAVQDPARALVGGIGALFVLAVSIHRIASGKLARISWLLSLVTLVPALYYAAFLLLPYREAFEKLVRG